MEKEYEEVYCALSKKIVVGEPTLSPVLVVFSAVPGSGKSELTKLLVRDYGFTRISNKDIRNALEETGRSDDVIIGEFTSWLLKKLTNRRSLKIVFDRNIDQWYEPSHLWASENDYKYVLVRIEVSRQKLEERLLVREGNPRAYVFNVLDFYIEQHERLAGIIKPDIVLREDYDLKQAAQRISDSYAQE